MVCQQKRNKLLPVGQEARACAVATAPSMMLCRFILFFPRGIGLMCQCPRAKQLDQRSSDHKGMCRAVRQLSFAAFSDETSSLSTAARTRCLACTPDTCACWQIQVCCVQMFCFTAWVYRMCNPYVYQALELLRGGICSHSANSPLLASEEQPEENGCWQREAGILPLACAKSCVRHRQCMSRSTLRTGPV